MSQHVTHSPRSVLHLAVRGAIAVFLAFASSSVLGDCPDFQSCLHDALNVQFRHVRAMFPPNCPDVTENGCLLVNNEMWPLPASATFQSRGIGTGRKFQQNTLVDVRPGELVPSFGTGRDIPVTGETGLTVAVQFFYAASDQYSTKTQGLFRLADEFGRTVMDFSIRDGRIVYGKRGLQGYFSLPFWDPPVPQGAVWMTFFARFQADGKLRVDGFAEVPVPDPDESPRLYWSQALLDNGWPITKYPSGKDPKTFLHVSSLELGTEPDGVVNGFSRLSAFKRSLTMGELQAIYTTQVESAALVLEELRPCNTGLYLTNLPISQVSLRTPCHYIKPKTSELNQQILSGLWKFSVPVNRDYLAWERFPEFRVLAVSQNDSESQQWKVELKADNYYVITADDGDVLSNDRNNHVAHIPPRSPLTANEYWRIRHVPEGYVFRSASDDSDINARVRGNGDRLELGASDADGAWQGEWISVESPERASAAAQPKMMDYDPDR